MDGAKSTYSATIQNLILYTVDVYVIVYSVISIVNWQKSNFSRINAPLSVLVNKKSQNFTLVSLVRK